MHLRRLLTSLAFACLAPVCDATPFAQHEFFAKSEQLPKENFPTHSTSSAPATPLNPPERKFTADSLYALLTAEIAGSRQQYDVALNNYVQQAKQTRDPQVAERATLIARYLNTTQTALEMSLLWVDTAPKNKEALANASLSLMQSGRSQEAFDMSKRLKSLGGEPLFHNIAASATNLNSTQRENLLQSYKAFLIRHPKDEQLLVGAGLLLQQQENYSEAMHYVRKTMSIYPRSIPAAILEANLLHHLKFDREAIARMADLLTFYPDNTSLRTQYAQLLTHYNLALAQKQFAILAEQLPKNADIALSLGIIAMERKDYKVATHAFEKLLDSDQHQSSGHYYLARLAEAQQEWTDAIFNYLQVEGGTDFLPATISLLDIFIRQQDFISAHQHMNRVRIRFPEQTESLYLLHYQALIKHNYDKEAEKLLNDALQAAPNSNKILFARAIHYSERRQNSDAERDLRKILQIDPNNAIALNSLGYLLADTSQRYREAEELLLKAQSLQPNDPAIIDSLGWLYFRTGNYPDALRTLRKAYESNPSATVAAHLGEVLWVTGSQVEARKIWHESLKQSDEDSIITNTIKRLQAE